MVYGECGVKNEWKKGDGFGARNGSSFPEGLNGVGGGGQMSIKIILLCQLSVKISDICRLSVNLS